MRFSYGHGQLVITEAVCNVLWQHRQTGPKQHEAGGILLGRVYPTHTVIERLSTPSAEDRSGRYFFERSVAKAQRIVNEAWKESGGEVIYLGEWHTHPEQVPRPSDTDRRLIRRMLSDSKMEIDRLFLVIVGLHGWYVACQNETTLTALTPIL